MIAFDTNVLLRLLLDDDPRQSRAVQVLLERTLAAGDHVLLPDIVLCEMEWVLDAVYGLCRTRIAQTLQRLLEAPEFEFSHRPAVIEALEDYLSGSADFSGYLIGRAAAAAGATPLYTFDRELLRAGGFARPG